MQTSISEIMVGVPEPGPREERQLDQLRDWLERPNWEPSESHLLLAGLDPDMSPSIRKGGWWLLPGTSEDLDDEEMQDRLRRTAGLGLKTSNPGDVIAAAIKAELKVPWLSIAASDSQCKLPAKIRQKVLKAEGKAASTAEGIKTRNQENRNRHAIYRKPMLDHAQRVLVDLKKRGYPMRAGKPNISAIVREIQTDPPLTFTNRAITGWFAKGMLKL
ncbi:hypothetical protein [Oricola indica]|jgi:hypothetical protein|uniref:hypothetical protein n=1 Tax=Oricola indica TaxID=2872591 RepID=UPI001CBF9888|nr:hypothetical protein [Oricola indica]